MDITSIHTASVTIPFAAPPDRIEVTFVTSPQRRVTFSAESTVSPEDAARKVREFLLAALAAAE